MLMMLSGFRKEKLLQYIQLMLQYRLGL